MDRILQPFLSRDDSEFHVATFLQPTSFEIWDRAQIAPHNDYDAVVAGCCYQDDLVATDARLLIYKFCYSPAQAQPGEALSDSRAWVAILFSTANLRSKPF